MFGLHLFHHSTTDDLKAAGKLVAPAIGSALTKAVALAAQQGNAIGAAAIAAVTAAEASGAAGADKKVAAVAAVTPVVIAEASKGGLTALEKDAAAFAGLVIEEVLAGLKQTPIVQLGEAILHLLGIA